MNKDSLYKKLMLDTLFFNSPYAIVILDKNQRIVNINENFTKIFQYNLKEIKGSTIKDLISPSNYIEIVDNNLKLLYQEKVIKQEGVRKRKDGKLVDVEVLAYPFINDSTIEGVCIMYIDISEKRKLDKQFQLHSYLVSALDNNEFTIYYQPIFDIHEDISIKGAEALLRWTNPILGNVPPNEFIPLAEETGQIITIGEWVLEQVCKQIIKWKSRGYTITPISINISVKQLERTEFAKTVINILKKNNVKPSNIELEITESISSGDVNNIISNLNQIKGHGIKISMDDFGTGFSSLGQLDLFELDKLKIDKIFIDDLVNAPKRQNIVKSIMAMAKSLNLTVVAEGIETNEQLYYLKKLGCQLGQGYLFSKPLPAADIEVLLDSNLLT